MLGKILIIAGLSCLVSFETGAQDRPVVRDLLAIPFSQLSPEESLSINRLFGDQRANCDVQGPQLSEQGTIVAEANTNRLESLDYPNSPDRIRARIQLPGGGSLGARPTGSGGKVNLRLPFR